MKHDRCQDYLDIYCLNPNKVGLAVVHEMDKVVARCIVWMPDGRDGERKWFDRIYAVNDEVKRDVQAELEVLGWQNISPKNCISNELDGRLDIVLDRIDFDYYPYVDTLHWMTKYSKTLSNYSGDYELIYTEGEHFESDHEYECDHCGDGIAEEDECTIGRGPREGLIYCDGCAVWSDYYDTYIPVRDSTNTTMDGWLLDDDVFELYNGKTCHEEHAVELYNDEYAHCDDDKIREDIERSKFIEGDENFVEKDGKFYHIESEEYKELLELVNE